MLRSCFGVLLLVPVLVTSCGFSAGEDVEPAPQETSAAQELEPEAEAVPEPVETASPGVESTVPTGTFATLEALCAEQRKMAAPRIQEVEAEWLERGVDEKISARCELSKTALAGAKIELRAPFLDVRAIEIETGRATEIHVVARSQAGWTAVPRASSDSWHEDPGCFSIERDTGIVSVRVEGDRTPALVVIEGTDRGARMEDLPQVEGQPFEQIQWMDVSHRARACRLEPSGFACDEPVVLRVDRVKNVHGRNVETEARFETTMTMSPEGHVLVGQKFDAEASAD